ncbi:AraC family transcriptional regulator [Cohnella sp. REN36]|uniref:AraC family transcriptional regulator n=1 Tax=Cohnella sp. REN36 TaxID=2887347 RepID=UPI001D153DB0|nr:AraC family transcriptional regulator [Cohnella sp. REN36]MCC3372128.1 AraC family transcriptional regulator [Cohnella sp. REN36]
MTSKKHRRSSLGDKEKETLKQTVWLETLQPEDTIPYLREMYFPPYITLAHVFNAEPGWSHQPRKQSQYQFQYVVEGTAEYEIGGQRIVATKGDLALYYPQQVHAVRTIPGEPYICVSIVFHFGTAELPLSELLPNNLGNFKHHLVEQQLMQIPAIYHSTELGDRMMSQGLLLQILGQLIQKAAVGNDLSHKVLKTKANLVQIQRYLIEHFTRNISLEELERVSGYSRNHLVEQYRRQFGVTPFEHIRLLRVERAKQLALNTGLSIGEIAEKVGYGDVHAFGKMFKKMTGVSLSQFCASLVINKP